MWTLYELSYSPWSEKARWALDHHKHRYRRAEYVPLFGAFPLRIAARQFSGRISVPLLVTEHGSIIDSAAIARHAESRSHLTAKLFGTDLDAAIDEWNARVEYMMSAGRAALVRRIAAHDVALRESLPSIFPAPVRIVGAPIGRFGAWFIGRKYGQQKDPTAELHVMSDFCNVLRAALNERRRLTGDEAPTLLGRFTFADVAAATAIQFISPVDDRWIPLGPGTREAWTVAALASQFADLVAWRDAIYARHRPRPLR